MIGKMTEAPEGSRLWREERRVCKNIDEGWKVVLRRKKGGFKRGKIFSLPRRMEGHRAASCHNAMKYWKCNAVGHRSGSCCVEGCCWKVQIL